MKSEVALPKLSSDESLSLKLILIYEKINMLSPIWVSPFYQVIHDHGLSLEMIFMYELNITIEKTMISCCMDVFGLIFNFWVILIFGLIYHVRK
jgi:hypothetical protein